MKRLNYILILLAATTTLLTGYNKDDKDDKEIIITSDFNPDFAKVLQEKGYVSDANYITLEEVRDITRLNVNGTYEDYKAGKGLSSLKGIEYFKSLTKLECDYNQLSSLDVSKNTKLTELWCWDNPGNGTTFPVIVWKGYESTLKDINIYYGTDYTSWEDNGQTITTEIIVK